IRQFDITGSPIGFGIDNNRLQAQLPAGPLDAHCDLAPIGDQHLAEASLRHWPIRNRDWPSSTSCPFSTRIAVTVPTASAWMILNDFIASIRQSLSPLST